MNLSTREKLVYPNFLNFKPKPRIWGEKKIKSNIIEILVAKFRYFSWILIVFSINLCRSQTCAFTCVTSQEFRNSVQKFLPKSSWVSRNNCSRVIHSHFWNYYRKNNFWTILNCWIEILVNGNRVIKIYCKKEVFWEILIKNERID